MRVTALSALSAQGQGDTEVEAEGIARLAAAGSLIAHIVDGDCPPQPLTSQVARLVAQAEQLLDQAASSRSAC